ncbi:hypothetical protein EDEG_01159 [Edhazardia aedis USNM 41457]|uniref:Uncharacterized protein n=1 Tax=Edhazardia aedis (strain USNM 41457) TaxID=1003232 RepID=J9DTM7_EDHAE|nr:hypothetical protein EDEG_01159 [Edhazardia aedis USNM 41457]|eukprot:EJW04632.1 hypothetical protein EDEG_01159 [Edhazardia aedis USNM 41457]
MVFLIRKSFIVFSKIFHALKFLVNWYFLIHKISSSSIENDGFLSPVMLKKDFSNVETMTKNTCGGENSMFSMRFEKQLGIPDFLSSLDINILTDTIKKVFSTNLSFKLIALYVKIIETENISNIFNQMYEKSKKCFMTKEQNSTTLNSFFYL